ncbi:hypothetical protein [Jeotgalibacillus salarius]|uniref:Uncharacterized protein n=1 Tax=Jeotgalibacillus salarius TaxID=546023 RepID=A0A4Y8LFC9_9BACL|nr:hypothetical protein [Jeotgalibacillus salarius]TFE01482.1 hypothetical protein E2626_07865 [Jeotgalibacillus salarius]
MTKKLKNSNPNHLFTKSLINYFGHKNVAFVEEYDNKKVKHIYFRINKKSYRNVTFVFDCTDKNINDPINLELIYFFADYVDTYEDWSSDEINYVFGGIIKPVLPKPDKN